MSGAPITQQEKDDFVTNYVDTTGYPATKTYTNNNNNASVTLGTDDAALLDMVEDLHEWMFSDGGSPDLSHLNVTLENVRRLCQVSKVVLFERGESQYYQIFNVCDPKLAL